ncbi:MAG: hypothetical protein KJ600_06250 [Nanoarchaeota archaeon]|nr:hypothetical protein [Nanoarchaeota archaeon]MBU1104126.1 hypothetical protein [Nanoarchaeota archaeon]
MSHKNLLVLLVSVFALAVVSAQGVNAAIQIDDVVINGIDSGTVGVTAGEYLEVEVFVSSNATHEDVTIEAWISGDKANSVETNPFVLTDTGSNSRRKTLTLRVPSNIDPEENLKLTVFVESEDGTSVSTQISLVADRESYTIEILSVDMQHEADAGESLAIDVVVKNRGRQLAEDVFLKVSIPELGLEERTYFGDLSPQDQNSPAEKEDAVERRTYLRIPANVEPGLYTVNLEVFDADSFDVVERRVLIGGGAVEDTMVVGSSQTETFSTGETGTYKLTIVNRGSVVRVYKFVVDSSENLNVDLSDALLVVPAGSSRTVEILADSAVRDEYTFSVDVLSEDGALIDQKTFRANVEEGNGRTGTGANTTVLLTVILAIVFIVLLVVLIVLLTRKPETKEEFGESYY